MIFNAYHGPTPLPSEFCFLLLYPLYEKTDGFHIPTNSDQGTWLGCILVCSRDVAAPTQYRVKPNLVGKPYEAEFD